MTNEEPNWNVYILQVWNLHRWMGSIMCNLRLAHFQHFGRIFDNLMANLEFQKMLMCILLEGWAGRGDQKSVVMCICEKCWQLWMVLNYKYLIVNVAVGVNPQEGGNQGHSDWLPKGFSHKHRCRISSY